MSKPKGFQKGHPKYGGAENWIKGGHASPNTEFKKGQVSAFKGKHHSKESIEKNAQAHKRENLSKDTLKKMRESRKKGIAEGSILIWNKGLTKGLDDRLKLKEQTKQKLRASHLGKKYKPMNMETKKNLSTIHSTPQTKERHRVARLKQVFPIKDTSIEKKLQEQLTTAGVEFDKHKAINGQPDIYVPSLKLAIFADGCYFHACHECKITEGRKTTPQITASRKTWYNDFRVKNDLELEGHKVIRLWEHDINKPDFDIMVAIKKVLSDAKIPTKEKIEEIKSKRLKI